MKFGYSFTCPNCRHEDIQEMDAAALEATVDEPYGRHVVCVNCGVNFDLPEDYITQAKKWLGLGL